MKNLNQIFINNSKKYNDKPLFWYKKNSTWYYKSWTEALNDQKRVVNYLNSLVIDKNQRIAIVHENSPEWCVADLSIMNVGAITVPGYLTSTENEIEYLLNDSKCIAAFVNYDVLLKIKKIENNLKFLKHIINFSSQNIDLYNISLVNYFDIIKDNDLNISSKEKLIKNSHSDLSCIIYTSGTSSKPKGVMLTHGSIIENLKGAKYFLDQIDTHQHRFLSL